MRTRKQHIPCVTTANAVTSAKIGSWSATAQALGFPPQMGATLSGVAAGKPSAVTPEGENLIRAALGLPPLDTVRVPACLSCGGAHVLVDCHGAEIAAVVALAPGESVRRPGKPRKRYPQLILRGALLADLQAAAGDTDPRQYLAAIIKCA